MKKTMTLFSTALVLLFVLTGCRVTQTEEGELPDVKVEVENGNLPKYDVDAPDIEVGTKEVTVTVPDVDIKTPDDPDYEDDDPQGGGNG